MLATSVAELLGRSIFEFMNVESRARAQTFARTNGNTSGEAHDFQLIASDGRTLWTRISAKPLGLHDGSHNGIVSLVTDVTERRALEEQLAHEARYDALTGVANRHTLFDVLAHALQERAGCAVLFADVDYFKNINDTYGHRTGDEILQAAAARIASSARQTDTVARLGGDEFIVVCAPIEDRAQAVDIAARIVAAFAEPVHVASQMIPVSVSIGIALASTTSDADSILSQADHALYAAKRAGRNRLEVATAI
jgi:diguanylate cyclase (GGDEF)-like protein